MAKTFSLTSPDDVFDLAVTSLCAQYGYQSTVDGVRNAETTVQFASRMILRFVRENIIAYQANQASNAVDTAVAAANTAMDSAANQVVVNVN